MFFRKKKKGNDKSESDKKIAEITNEPAAEAEKEEPAAEKLPEPSRKQESDSEAPAAAKQPEPEPSKEQESEPEKKANEGSGFANATESELNQRFREIYEPTTIEDYEIKPRSIDEIPDFDKVKPGLREKALEMDKKRAADKAQPSKEAANEIFGTMMETLTKEGKNNPEYIVAAFASLGGRVCVESIMRSLFAMTDKNDLERGKNIVELGAKIGILVGNKNGTGYVFGEKINEAMSLFCWIAFRSSYQDIARNDLANASKPVFDQCGTDSYWNTPYNSEIGKTPEEMINLYANQFELIFSVYCRFPQERIAAVAFAAQAALYLCLDKKAITVEKASSIMSEYIMRAAHYFPRSLESSILQSERAAFTANGADLMRRFTELYSPYVIKDYVIEERRSYDDIPETDGEQSHIQLRTIARQVDDRRKEDPVIGAKLAANEIYANVINWLNTDQRVQSEALLAILASVGGRICVQGVMNTLIDMTSKDDPDRKKLVYSLASLLQVMIAETADGEAYIMGDRIANEFMVFLNNAMGESVDVEKIMPHAKKIAGLGGKEEYWKTSYDDIVGKSPKELADIFTDRFDIIFKTYCRFPQERMLAFAFAAQKATKEVITQQAIDKNDAIEILTEYGWRTSHYWGKFEI